jgi:integrase
LRRELVAHKLRTGRDGDDLVFGRSASEPFTPSTVRRHALDAWASAGLAPIGLHEARHTWVSICIAAGVNPHTLMVSAGHGSYDMTMRHYGKVMPGSLDEAASRVDAYLQGSPSARGTRAGH